MPEPADHAGAPRRRGRRRRVKFAAFPGKAALVMRSKGCDNASTIHSLIYRARESAVEQPEL